MTQNNRKSFVTTRQLTTIAILSAVAAVLFMLEIPVVLFYKLDFSTLPALLGGFAMGPLPGTIILAVKSALGLLHTTTNGVGEIADFLMGLAMVLPASLIYRRIRSRKGAVVGMIVGTVVAIIVAAFANLYVLIPFYSVVFNMPVEAIIGMGQKLIPAIQNEWSFVLLITAPFNLLKWVVNSVITGLIYKPLSPVLHGMQKNR